jgi:hypothetical protein
LEYDVLSGGAGVRITRLSYIGAPQHYTIPDLIEGLPVTEIGPSAFYAASLSSIDIPNTVERIGNIHTGSAPGTPLGKVFNPSIKSINVPSGSPDFSSTNGILYHNAGAELIYCPGGKSGTVTIPMGVTSIALDAFDDCRGITAFDVEAGNTTFDTVNDVLFDIGLTTLNRFPPGKSGSYTIPTGTDTISEKAFYGCSINSLVIPSTVTVSIGNMAFAFNKSLTLITFEGSPATTVGLSLFYDNGPGRKIRVPSTTKAAYLAKFNWHAGALAIPILTNGTGLVTVSGDRTAEFLTGREACVFDSIGSGTYTIVSSNFVSPDTEVYLSGYSSTNDYISPHAGVQHQIEGLAADVIEYP